MENIHQETLLSGAMGFVIGRECLQTYRTDTIERRDGAYVIDIGRLLSRYWWNGWKFTPVEVRTSMRVYGALSLILIPPECRRLEEFYWSEELVLREKKSWQWVRVTCFDKLEPLEPFSWIVAKSWDVSYAWVTWMFDVRSTKLWWRGLPSGVVRKGNVLAAGRETSPFSFSFLGAGEAA